MIDFNYDPLTEEQALQERFNLMKEGTYDAVIEKYTPKTSQAGNSMAELVLDVYDEAGKPHQIYDYLVFSRNMAWKLKHFCDSAGLSKEYEEGKFHPDMAVGKNVSIKLVIQTGKEIPMDKLKGKAPGAKYPDKNSVEDYLVRQAQGDAPRVVDPYSDEIPF